MFPANTIEKVNRKVRAGRIIELAQVAGPTRVQEIMVGVHFLGTLVAMLNINFLAADKLLGEKEEGGAGAGSAQHLTQPGFDSRPIEVNVVIALDNSDTALRRFNIDKIRERIKNLWMAFDDKIEPLNRSLFR